ncbi:MAG: hypothetical protein HUJ75_00285 [Parasporobacterium sp.]|nr:hypothetical protein [Parasporobacterium sp.]
MIISICLGIAAFAAFGLFECVQAGIIGNKKSFNIWFIAGLVLLGAMWILNIIKGFRGTTFTFIIGALIAASSIIIYISLLRVASPGNYKGETKNSEVSYAGLYGQCRHPGFYVFIIMSFALAMTAGTMEAFICAILTSVLNTVYIIVQDVYWFEMYIDGYSEYKKKVPFFGFRKGNK